MTFCRGESNDLLLRRVEPPSVHVCMHAGLRSAALGHQGRQVVVLRCEPSNGPGRQAQFACVVGWMPKAGAYPFRCNLVWADECADATDGKFLELRRKPFVAIRPTSADPRCRTLYESPFTCAHSGMLDHTIEEEFVASLLKGGMCSADIKSLEVRLSLMCSERLTFDRFKYPHIALSSQCFSFASLQASQKARTRAEAMPQDDGDFLAPPLTEQRGTPATSAMGESEFEVALREILEEAERDEALCLLKLDAEVEQEADCEGDVDAEVPEEEPGMPVVAEGLGEESEQALTTPVELGRRQEVFRDYLAASIDVAERELCVQCVPRSLGVFDLRDTLMQPSEDLGRMNDTFKGSCVAAVCRRHRGCRLLLSIKPKLGIGLPEVRCHLTQWLAAATVMTGAEHAVLSQHVKTSLYNVKPRGG